MHACVCVCVCVCVYLLVNLNFVCWHVFAVTYQGDRNACVNEGAGRF